jgi:hypothetical protein
MEHSAAAVERLQGFLRRSPFLTARCATQRAWGVSKSIAARWMSTGRGPRISPTAYLTLPKRPSPSNSVMATLSFAITRLALSGEASSRREPGLSAITSTRTKAGGAVCELNKDTDQSLNNSLPNTGYQQALLRQYSIGVAWRRSVAVHRQARRGTRGFPRRNAVTNMIALERRRNTYARTSAPRRHVDRRQHRADGRPWPSGCASLVAMM